MIRAEQRAYFKALGGHIGQLRKARGYTQTELARAIGVSHQRLPARMYACALLQAVFAWELGERRVSVLVLSKLAKVFSISVEELVGMGPVRAHKGRLSWRAMRHAERIQALPKTQQRFLIRILDTLEVPRR